MPNLNTKIMKDFYAGSDMRYGVLAWYPFVPSSSVFERSDGLLTAWLQQKCERVVSDQPADVSLYDYMVLLDPCDMSVAFLQNCRKRLKPEGRLLLLFENPYGLQYFAGKRAPETGLPFIFPRRESKKEVSARLRLAGFAKQKWYYPFPNHYFAKEIYSEAYLPNEFMNHRPSDFLEDDYTKVFDEREVWREAVRNGAFAFLCNSYLVEAVVGEDALLCDIDYAAVTIYREHDRAFATTVHAGQSVRKTALYPEGSGHLQQMAQTHDYLRSKGIPCIALRMEGASLVMPRINLPTLWDWQSQKLSEGVLGKETLFRQFDFIRDCIYKANADGRVYWELGTANSFYDEKTDSIVFFDQEFYWEHVDPDMALVRALWQLMWTDAADNFAVTRQWLEELKARYGIAEKWDELLKLARDATHEYVFNPSAILPLEKSMENAVKRVAAFRQASMMERRRFERFRRAAEKLRVMGKHRIAVYGYGARGKTFVNVLQQENFEVVAILDRDMAGAKAVDADAIVVTPLKEGMMIGERLRRITDTEVFVVEELLGEKTEHKAMSGNINLRCEGESNHDEMCEEVKEHFSVGYVSGTFDMFHVGHLNLLKRAKACCEHLIVGVLADECVMQSKGRAPIIPLEDRLEIVRACRYVDEVDVTTPELIYKVAAWEKYHFDAMFTGDDHKDDGWGWEEPELEKLGAKLVFFPYTQKVSSTKLRETITLRNP